MNKCNCILSHIQLIWANIQSVKKCFKKLAFLALFIYFPYTWTSQYCKKSWWYYQIEVSWCGSEWLAQYSISETGGSPANYATPHYQRWWYLYFVFGFVFCTWVCVCSWVCVRNWVVFVFVFPIVGVSLTNSWQCNYPARSKVTADKRLVVLSVFLYLYFWKWGIKIIWCQGYQCILKTPLKLKKLQTGNVLMPLWDVLLYMKPLRCVAQLHSE